MWQKHARSQQWAFQAASIILFILGMSQMSKCNVKEKLVIVNQQRIATVVCCSTQI